MPEITVSVSYETVDTPAEMADQLQTAIERGWYGTITAIRHDGVDKWVLVLNIPTNPAPVTVTFGDVLLWDGTAYQSLDQDTFNERYGS